MALVKTTASAAIAATDSAIQVTSATGFAAGYYVRVDQELMQVLSTYVSGTTIPVRRGIRGTFVDVHGKYADVVCGTGADWASPAPASLVEFPLAGKTRQVKSYGASGAIDLPVAGSDSVAILNYTNALTMTLADPTKDLDGSILYIVATGNAAHTVTTTSGVGGAGGSYDVFTFNGNGTAGVMLMAVNSLWVSLGPVGGTLTNVVASLA